MGVKVQLRSLAQSSVIDAAGTPNTAPMVWSGGLAWTQDYPDPSDFYWPILSCRSAVQGGWNWPVYCDKKLDARADKADRMVAPGQQSARLSEYAKIFSALNKQAVWVPVYHEVRYIMKSGRLVGGVDDLLDPTHFISYERPAVKP